MDDVRWINDKVSSVNQWMNILSKDCRGSIGQVATNWRDTDPEPTSHNALKKGLRPIFSVSRFVIKYPLA
jgi:hypothetical protein